MKEYKGHHFPKCSRIYTENVVFLHPGEYHFAEKPTLIHTVLGSCVAVVMFDQAHQYGAMCHALLDSPSSARKNQEINCYKYMNCVIDEMIKDFAEHGVSVKSLVAKVFGGAQMLLEQEKIIAGPRRFGVGERNVQMALRMLQKYGCEIAARDLGGKQGRKIYFLSHVSDVFLKRIQNS